MDGHLHCVDTTVKHSYDELERQAASIRAHIDDLQIRLADILTLRNKLLPIGRMPEDILFQIFSWLVPSLTAGAVDADVLAISHVNRCWRRLALAFPILWTQIPLWRSPPHVRLMLERSQGMSINFAVRKGSVPAENYLHITAERHRIRAVAFRYEFVSSPRVPPEGMKLLKLLLASPALEHLCFSHVPMEPAEWREGEATGIVQTMRQMDLLNTVPSPQLLRPFVHPVVRFTFAYPDSARATTSWAESLLNTLRHMPNLERLTIANTHITNFPPTTTSPAKVTLPRLALFHAEEVLMGNIAAILPFLDVPISARFHISTYGNKSFSFISPAAVFAGARSLALTYLPHRPSSLVLRAYLVDSPSDPSVVKTEISIRGPVPPENRLATLRELTEACGAPVFETYELVNLSFPLEAHRRPSLEMGLPQCRRLRLVRCSLEVVVALMVALGSREGGTTAVPRASPPVCSSLLCIEVCGLSEDNTEDVARLQSAVQTVKEQRRMLGVPLECVTVENVPGYESTPRGA